MVVTTNSAKAKGESESTSLFPTTVIGSLPRTGFVNTLLERRESERQNIQEIDGFIDSCILYAIRLQELAGLDQITDGEWRRNSYLKVFSDNVRGFQPGLIDLGMVQYPAVVERIEYDRPFTGDAAQFLVENTTKRTKVTLPSAFTLGYRVWDEAHSKKAYPKRSDFMRDCVPILRQEIEHVLKSGVDTIQLDDPWLAVIMSPKFQQAEGLVRKEIEYLQDLCIDLLNETLDGFEGVETGVHLCHAHFNYNHGYPGSYEKLMSSLQKAKVDIISLEYSSKAAGALKALKNFPKHTKLGLGCVDHCSREVESSKTIVKRVERAMKYVDAERIVMHPDCGFAPSATNPTDLMEALLKLEEMVEAAMILRERYG